MKVSKINYLKNIISKKKYLYFELNIKILKSIIQNKKVKPKIRAYCFYELNKKKIKIRRNLKICLSTSRYKGSANFINISRQQVKYLNSKSLITNLAVKSW